MMLASCSNGGGSTTATPTSAPTSGAPTSGQPTSGDPTSGDTSATTGTTGSTSETPIDDYDEWCNTWSQAGHLYIHYLRTDGKTDAAWEEYQNYCIWIWQNAPQDLEGSLWACSSTEVQKSFTTMSTSWMTNVGGTGQNVVKSGVICDIDLTRDDIKGGKTGGGVTFKAATRVGFLIVDQTTMNGGSHWTSDGGANTYIEDFDEMARPNGSIHIFCTQGSVSDFTPFYDPNYVANPVVKDTTGQYRSTSDVNSSVWKSDIPRTSNSFKQLGLGYQIFVASFRDSDGSGMGDIRGIIDSLDYLKDLGVQVLWLTPIQSSESYHGYDATDFYTIDSKFGSLYDYQELMAKAHEKGMKVLMDLVLNHTSKNNKWFKRSQKAATGKDEFGNEIKYRDVYRWKFKGDKVQLWDNATSSYKQVAVENHPDWYKDGESNYYYYGKFGSGMAELNYDCQATRNLVINMAKYWLSLGLDGYRLDAVKHIYMKDEVDNTGSDLIVQDISTKTYYDEEMKQEVTKLNDYSTDITKNINWWKEFSSAVKAVYPECFLVGENFDGYGARMAPYYQALDSQFDFSLYYHNYEYLYKRDLGYNAGNMGVTQYNETYKNYSGNGTNSISNVGNVPMGNRPDFINGAFTSNHDVLRAINHIAGDVNEINSSNKSVANSKAKVHAASTILAPGISWIYYGDELGMSSNVKEHLEHYTNKNCEDIWYRQPFKWSDDLTDMRMTSYKFSTYKVELDKYNKTIKCADEQIKSATDGDMYDVYKALCDLKKQIGGSITYTGYETSNVDLLHYQLKGTGGTYYVYINCGHGGGAATIDTSGASKSFYINCSSASGTSLPAYGIYVKKA